VWRIRIVASAVMVSGLWAVAALPAAGQRIDTTRPALRAALSDAQGLNRMVRFRSIDGREVTGRVGFVGDTIARVGTTPLDIQNQVLLEARYTREDPVWDGAAIGAVVAAPFGYVAAAMASTIGDQRFTHGQVAGAVLGAAAMGALIGVIVDGAREGAPDWRSVWKRATR